MSTLVCWYVSIFHISAFPRSYILNSCYILLMWLGYPSFHNFTGSISPTSCVLILTCLRSHLSICTILFIKSVTGIRVKVKVEVKVRVKVKIEGCIYILYSYYVYKVFFSKTTILLMIYCIGCKVSTKFFKF